MVTWSIGEGEQMPPPHFLTRWCSGFLFKIDEKIIRGAVANLPKSRGSAKYISICAPTFVTLATPLGPGGECGAGRAPVAQNL